MDNGELITFKTIRSLKVIYFLLIISFMSYSQNAYSKTKYKKIYYISSSTGKDTNLGSIDQPFRTINHLNNEQKKNCCIRLRRGDLFYENIKGFSNCTIESYGKGNKPIICGFKILKNINSWTNIGNNIWKLDLSISENFTGFPLDLAEDKKRFNNVGCMFDAENNKIYGHIVNSIKELKSNNDLYVTDIYKASDINDTTFKYIFIKSDTCPINLGNVCFSVYSHGVFNINNCIIKEISVIGFGMHGMCNLNNTIVDRCNIDIIGGSIQTNTPHWVRFGNGIEFWISKKPVGNSLIKNCIISRTFDCGSTIQGSPKDIGNAINIKFLRNKYIYCRQAFEHFLNSSNTNPQYINCKFSNNICYMMGQNQFNSPESRDADILSYENTSKPINITNNIFFGGNYYCGYVFAPKIKRNKVYLYYDQYLNHYHGIKNYPTIYSMNLKSIAEYKQRTKDNSSIYILERNSKEDSIYRMKILKEIFGKGYSRIIKKYE